ncbi:MAG: N-acetyltransferase family protein [Xanthobacteraceae bacterium]|uniref:GNAT family N-acetyltransferase n=1 Tax=Pseudolabrys sp. TaxID=1960880 RepID=UPI003D0BB5F4
MSVVVRPARPDDAALIFALVRELAEYEKLLGDVDATEASLSRALFSAEPRVFCDIAEWDGEPCGFALWFMNFSSFRGRHGIYLEDLFVRPSHRGCGIGKALLVNLAKRCVEKGWTRFEWSVLDWNAPSIAFYKSLGAAILDEWKICRVTGDALKTLAARG